MNISVELYPEYEKRDNSWIVIAQDLHVIMQQIKTLENKRVSLKNTLIELSKNQNSKGGNFIFTRSEIPGRIKYCEIPELQKVNLDNYRGASFCRWRLEKI